MEIIPSGAGERFPSLQSCPQRDTFPQFEGAHFSFVLILFVTFFSFFEHTTPFTPTSGLVCCPLARRPRLVRNLCGRLLPAPAISSIKTSTMITASNSLGRERDALSFKRCSSSHHGRFRAVPRTNRTRKKANPHNHSATSSTSGSPTAAPSLLWQCSCADASPGADTDVASAG